MKTKNKSSFFGLILCIALVIGLSMTVACGGRSTASTGPPPPQSITITTTSLPAGNLAVLYSAFIEATGGTGAFTWSASAGLPPGLTLDTSGNPTNPGVLEGTPTAKGTFNFTATVTDTAGTSATKTFSVTIGAPPPLSIAPKVSDGTVNVAYAGGLGATGGVTPYAWSLAAGSTLPSNLTLDTSGNISGTPTQVGKFTFAVMVRDSETPAMTATGNVSITVNTLLFGHYAFLFNGSDANGAVVAAGSFTADGQGGITGGVEDINRHVPGPATDVSFTGSYSIGKDNRGTLTLTSSLGTSTFAFAIDSSGNRARFVELDASGTRGTGVMEGEDFNTVPSISACTLAFINGDFAFGISGDDLNKGRVAMAGRFHADGAGNLSGGLLDENDASVLSSDVVWSGTYAAPATSSPRCTATFTPTGLPDLNFAYYPTVVGAFLVEVDPVAASVPLTAGRVLPAPGPSGPGTLTNASLNAPSVGGLTGFSAGASAPDVQLVFFSPDGVGNVTITQDENKGGVVTTGTVLKGTYDVSSNGRVTLTVGTNPPVLYLVSANEAFMLGTDDAATFGLLEPGGGGTLSNATIAGNFISGTDTPAGTKVTDLSGVIAFDGVSALTGTLDESTLAVNLADQALTGTYSVTNTPVKGHGTFTITPSGGPPANFLFQMLTEVRCLRKDINGHCTQFSPPFASKVVAIPSDATQTNPAVLVLDKQ